MKWGFRKPIAVAMVVVALAACHRNGGEAASPVTKLDDPRVVQGDPAGSVVLYPPTYAYTDENFFPVHGGPEVLGATRLGPDIVKVYLTRSIHSRGSLSYPYAAYAVQCRTRRLRMTGAGSTLDAASRGAGVQAAITPWPEHAGQVAILEAVCANRMRCEFHDKNNPCEQEMRKRLDEANARAAAEKATSEPGNGEPPASRE